MATGKKGELEGQHEVRKKKGLGKKLVISEGSPFHTLPETGGARGSRPRPTETEQTQIFSLRGGEAERLEKKGFALC